MKVRGRDVQLATFLLDRALHQRLHWLSVHTNRSMSDLVRGWIRDAPLRPARRAGRRPPPGQLSLPII